MTVATPIVVRHNYQPATMSLRVAVETITVAAATVDWSYRQLADPRQIQFISNHTGIVTAWLWDFGQAEITSPLRDPQFQYLPTGDSQDFTVRLTINGSIYEEKVITVYNLIALPGANDLDAYTLTADEVNNMTVSQANTMTVT